MPLVYFDTPENMKKPKVFWGFQGVQKETSGMKWVKHGIKKKHFDKIGN